MDATARSSVVSSESIAPRITFDVSPIMKYIIPAVSLIIAASLQAEDTWDILPGSAFGDGWELVLPATDGVSIPLTYINRLLPHQPIVTIDVIEWASSKAARFAFEKKFSGPYTAQEFKKCTDMTDAYDSIPPAQNKRYILIGKYWLTVEQVGGKDNRKIFIEKYLALLKKNG